MDFIREHLYRKIDKMSRVKSGKIIVFNNTIKGILFEVSGIKDNKILTYSKWGIENSIGLDIDLINTKSLLEIFEKLKKHEYTLI
jgi:hypothetical protein